MKNHKVMFVALSILLLAACGGGGGSNGGDGSGNGGTGSEANDLLPGLITASAVVDVNKDGKNDIVIGFQGEGYSALLLLLNDGDGSSFSKKVSAFPTQYKAGNGSAVVIEPGDFDGDGNTDILAVTVDASPASYYASAQIQLYLDNGNGTFRDASSNITNGTWPATIPKTPDETDMNVTGEWPGALRVADIDGDGSLDFVAAGGGRSGIIYLNNGHGQFAPAAIRLTQGKQTAIASGLATIDEFGLNYYRIVDVLAGDINHDGKMDCYAPHAYPTTFINTSKPNSVSFTVIFMGPMAPINNGVMLDIDGDGELDVIGSMSIGNEITPKVPVIAFLGDGTGHFIEDNGVLSPQPSVDHARQFLAADVNGDGRLDVLISDHGLDKAPFPGARNWLLINNGSGVLVDRTATSLDLLTSFTHQAAIGDFTGDGKPDILLNNGSGCGNSSMTCQKEPRFWKNVGAGVFNSFDPKIK